MNTRSFDSAKICEADKAAATGRLMLGELRDLEEFISVGSRVYGNLSRRERRSGIRDVRHRLGSELDKFCRRNFDGMTIEALAKLYDNCLPHLKATGVYAIPLQEFNSLYSAVRPTALAGSPQYATAVLSTRGLQFLFPEHLLADDIRIALNLALGNDIPGMTAAIRGFAARTCLSATFGLVEAILNGLLWDAISRGVASNSYLTAKQREMLADPTKPSLRDKLVNVPAILVGSSLPKMDETDRLLDLAKRYRDSLTHPSPFTAPARHGGYDKLEYFYSINERLSMSVLGDALVVMTALFKHLNRTQSQWFGEIEIAYLEALKRYKEGVANTTA